MSDSHRQVSGIQKQGWLHEESALKMIGGDAVNLNHHPELTGMGIRGGNYPTFDIFSSTEICSVKSHINNDGGANIQNYKSDFSEMLGWGKAFDGGLSPLEQDAQRITECATRGIPIPNELISADPDQVVSFLQENTIMRIPTDHVEAVRSALVADAKQLPGNYFLPEDPSEAQLQSLADRIQSTGLSGAEIYDQLNSEEQLLGDDIDYDQSLRDTMDSKTPSAQEAVEQTAQETAEIIQENPLDSVEPDESENEDYDYSYGYL